MSVHTFNSYSGSIENHYKKKAVDIYNNRKKPYGKMSSYVDFLTGYENNERNIFKAPPPKYINMSKAPNNENTPLVICKNDKLEFDDNGNKIITKPFTWFVNNNNHFDTNNKKRNNNLLDNLIKNDSDLYKDTYLSNMLNGFDNCIYTAGKESDLDNIRSEIASLNKKYKDKVITKDELDKQRRLLNESIPWIKSSEDKKLKNLGKYTFKDGFSNYQETKKQLGLTYFASLSIIILFIIYRLK